MEPEELKTILADHGSWLNGHGGDRADLSGANLSGANLRGANLDPVAAARLMACPASGAFTGWKKCRNGVIVRLTIPADARRSSSTGRKCRSEFADVEEVIGSDHGVSMHDGRLAYRAGERVTCDSWCEDRWRECAGGIHFYITREEAEAHL